MYPATAVMAGGLALSAQASTPGSGAERVTDSDPDGRANCPQDLNPDPNHRANSGGEPDRDPDLGRDSEHPSITFVGAGPLFDSGTAVSTVTVGAPAGVQPGDALLAEIVVYDGTASDVPTPPSGWTAIRHDSTNGGKASSRPGSTTRLRARTRAGVLPDG